MKNMKLTLPLEVTTSRTYSNFLYIPLVSHKCFLVISPWAHLLNILHGKSLCLLMTCDRNALNFASFTAPLLSSVDVTAQWKCLTQAFLQWDTASNPFSFPRLISFLVIAGWKKNQHENLIQKYQILHVHWFLSPLADRLHAITTFPQDSDVPTMSVYSLLYLTE